MAERLGEWLLEIQGPDGAWNGGLHPPKDGVPSVFNTGQILLGMAALYRRTEEARWLDAAQRAALWLARGVSADGTWSVGNYQAGFNPSYYTRVAWPMLEVWALSGEEEVRSAAERVLGAMLARRKPNGVIGGWAFEPEKPAFTHTIAYTLRGLLESARLLDDWAGGGVPTLEALDRLRRKAELTGGRLPGAFWEDWRPVDRYVCLTGNAQTAICLLMLHRREDDLRLVNAASKLVDYVCDAQWLDHPVPGVRGAVAGSKPIWGRYLTFRYPNWAAKFHADAIMLLSDTLRGRGL